MRLLPGAVFSRSPTRVSVAGALVELLVLAADGNELVGVDLASGAFVRARHPGCANDLEPLDVARGEIADRGDVADAARPELVQLTGAPQRCDRLGAKRADRVLRSLLHPAPEPLLGFRGPAVPYWTLTGARPSVALVQPSSALQVHRRGQGFTCRLAWRALDHHLPLADRRLAAELEALGRPRYVAEDLSRVLGHRVDRALVVLTPPQRGYCYKVVAGFLPRT